MGQFVWYHAPMSKRPPSLQDLVTAVVDADDPTLLQRACAALDLILANDEF